jgi:hypothetical protein
MKSMMGTLPHFEYAYVYGEPRMRVSPIKRDNLAISTQSLRFLVESRNSHPPVESVTMAVPNNSAPELLWEGYAAVLSV